MARTWTQVLSLTRRVRSKIVAVAAIGVNVLLTIFVPSMAQVIDFGGVNVTATGFSKKKIIDDGGTPRLLLYYTTPTSTSPPSTPTGTLSVPYPGTMRILAVGGGGAGGTIKAASYLSIGAGGGGGAGELVDRSGIPFKANSEHLIFVGAGGVANGVNTASSVGDDGKPTYIQVDNADLLRVKGGGGGGGQSDGRAGGSGGGGSRKDKNVLSGGAAEPNEADGLGHAGGASINRYGGGGGGAGADGAEADSSSYAGAGGNGIESDIDPEDVKYYAGGGGGGSTYNGRPGAAGGFGGGGTGGNYTANATAVGGEATPGVDGLGGGGGGGGRFKVGARGGSGIVIISISLADIEVPLIWQEIPLFSDGKIFIDSKATWTRVNPSDLTSDIIITYSDPNARGGLRFFDPEQPGLPPVWANARVLAIGGGGGGGCVTEQIGGAGAGGGAGGYIDKVGLVFDNSVEFSISVGKGGKGGSANEVVGENGTSSTLKTNGVNVVKEALGGGGGGAHSVGNDGGSGGGGSRGKTKDSSDSYGRVGGAAIVDPVDGTVQGFKGGDAMTGIAVGAGGGGAGGAGQDTYVNGAVDCAGDGGAGVKNTITGEERWYAAGGGGAYVNNDDLSFPNPGGRGGSDVGGNGAGIENGVAVAAKDGKDGTGSGGGGGVSRYGITDETAGNGGSGVVIIRLSGFVVRDIPVPEQGREFVYDGREKVGVDEFFAYTIVSNKDVRTTWSVGVDADNYEVTVRIADTAPYGWGDVAPGSATYHGDRKIKWKIVRTGWTSPRRTTTASSTRRRTRRASRPTCGTPMSRRMPTARAGSPWSRERPRYTTAPFPDTRPATRAAT